VIALLVAAGAAVGAPLRYGTDVLVSRRATGFPYGTIVVNVVGSFVLGLLTGLGLHHGLGPYPKALLGTGFCGTLTTFSTYSQETTTMLQRGATARGVANLLGSAVLGTAAAALGLWAALA